MYVSLGYSSKLPMASREGDNYLQGMIQPVLKQLARTIQINHSMEVIISLPPAIDRAYIITLKTMNSQVLDLCQMRKISQKLKSQPQIETNLLNWIFSFFLLGTFSCQTNLALIFLLLDLLMLWVQKLNTPPKHSCNFFQLFQKSCRTFLTNCHLDCFLL